MLSSFIVFFVMVNSFPLESTSTVEVNGVPFVQIERSTVLVDSDGDGYADGVERNVKATKLF
jgi:hypothetical protein